MGGDAALELLRDEFEDDDLTSKRRAAERIDFVAKALGPDAARKQLIPWLLEHMEQEDEVLFLFAQKCHVLLSLLGGQEHLELMIPILESLLAVEETYVRDAALQSTTKIVEAVKNVNPLVEMVIRLSKSEWFTAKLSALALCTPLFSKGINGDLARSLSEMYFSLCKDETPMVRRSAAKELESVLKHLDTNELVNEVIPMFTKLGADPQESVALNWIGAVGDIAACLNEQQNSEHLLGMVKQFCTDRSWRIRFTIAQCFDKVCKAMGTNIAQETLLSLFCELLRDPEGEVRNVVSVHVVVVGLIVGPELFIEYIMPVLSGLLDMDQQRTVRLSLSSATIDSQLLQSLGSNRVKEHMVPVWEQCLRDAAAPFAPEVRLIIIRGMDQVISVLGSSFIAKSWSPLLRELFETSRNYTGGLNDSLMNPNGLNGMGEEIEHPQWRIRVAILCALEKLSTAEDPAVDKLIVDLWYSCLTDEVFEVRMGAATILGTFSQPSSPIGSNKVSSLFIPRLLEYFKQAKQKYHQRVVFVHAFGALLSSSSGLVDPLFGVFEKSLDDKVPNVRIAALSVLENVSDENFKEKFNQQIHSLMEDSDPDVAEEARRVVGTMLV